MKKKIDGVKQITLLNVSRPHPVHQRHERTKGRIRKNLISLPDYLKAGTLVFCFWTQARTRIDSPDNHLN